MEGHVNMAILHTDVAGLLVTILLSTFIRVSTHNNHTDPRDNDTAGPITLIHLASTAYSGNTHHLVEHHEPVFYVPKSRENEKGGDIIHTTLHI